jgi:two-component system sensor histidine kinase YesM
LLNQWSATNTSNQIVATMQSQVHFHLHNVEMELQRMVTQQLELIEDRDLKYLGALDEILSDIERTSMLNALYYKLRYYANSSNYIENASAHLLTRNKTISSRGYVNYLDSGKIDEIMANQDGLFQVWNDKLLFTTTPFFTDLKGPSPLYMLETELSIRMLNSMLAQLQINGQGQALLFFKDANIVIGNPQDSELLSILRSSLASKKYPSEHNTWGTFEWNGEEYVIVSEQSSEYDFALAMFIPQQVLMGAIDQYKTWFWILSGISLVIIVLFAFSMFRFIHQPIKKLIRGFLAVERGDFEQRIEYQGKDEFHYLFNQYNRMIQKLKKLIEEVYEQKYRAQKAELKQLQSQINPHFLYNSFFTLNSMVLQEDSENLNKFSRHLGEYFYFMTRDGQDVIDLETEMKYVTSYIEIQNFRFLGRIQVSIDPIPAPVTQLKVPRMIIQPIVENAYNHGLKHVQTGGRIRIRFGISADRLRMIVEDNGNVESETIQNINELLSVHEAALESTGLVNVHRRLQLCCGEDSGLRLTRSDLGGLAVTFEIMIRRVTQHHV